MIDELAKAIWFASALNITGNRNLAAEWDAMNDYDRQPYYRKARAVLARLREPTEKMIAASIDAMWTGKALRCLTAPCGLFTTGPGT